MLVDKLKIYETRSLKKSLQFKFNKNILNMQIVKLRLLTQIGVLDGIFLLNLLKRKINLAKEVFVLEIEQGQEVFIPLELS